MLNDATHSEYFKWQVVNVVRQIKRITARHIKSHDSAMQRGLTVKLFNAISAD